MSYGSPFPPSCGGWRHRLHSPHARGCREGDRTRILGASAVGHPAPGGSADSSSLGEYSGGTRQGVLAGLADRRGGAAPGHTAGGGEDVHRHPHLHPGGPHVLRCQLRHLTTWCARRTALRVSELLRTRRVDTPILQAAGGHKRFGTMEVLLGSDMTWRRGEVVALIGASGSGQTTLC